ncbi:DUF2637 domain-containing protein [Mycolicibacterium nivoides]|uniref:DUF2637 domain-containing protein n=1 Tax=Mycolicibacterium nivoides TaxID=2487344 RepID=UPI0013DE12A2|nr:DUF2637 domain-containing protein [Mycolicibacterium nivoides]
MKITEKISDPLREVRAILWTLLISATVASIAGNIAHTVIVHGLHWATIGPVVLALLGPTALLGLFHLMAAWARVQGAGLAIFWFYLLAIIGLASAAFRLSFAALRDLALHYNYGRFDAALFPLILDGLIAVCTVGLVAATRPRRKEKRAARPSIPQRVRTWWRGTPADAEPVQAVQTTANRDAEHADTPEYPDTLTWLAPVHSIEQTAVEQAVHQSTETAPEPAEQPVHQPADDAPAPASDTGALILTSDDEAVHRPGAPVHQESETQPAHTVERPHLVAVHRTDAPAQDGAETPVVQPVHLAQAEAVVQAGASELPVSRIAEVFARKDRGESQNTIAKAVPVNKRTVSKILAAREELDTTTAEEPEPAFA